MNYCTLFDSYYMAKGLAMYDSLMKLSSDSFLYIMAFDDNCFEKLSSLNLPNMVVENVTTIETEEILGLKRERTRAEYCWTCGPIVINHFIEKYKLSAIIYLDSDLFFMGDPKIALDEIGSSSVVITEQGISEKAASLYGRYCVQYMYFKNDANGMAALKWWKESCIDWCYQRFEEGKFGDQKYLDQFPLKFNNVSVIKNYGVGIAPWNMYRYKYDKVHNTIYYKKQNYPVVFFHMHALKFEIKEHRLCVITEKYLSRKAIENYYNDYLNMVVTVYNKYLYEEIHGFIIQSASWMSRVVFLIKEPFRSNKSLRKVYSLITGTK